MMRMVRKVQKQLEAGKVVSQEATRMDCTYIEREIQRLLNDCLWKDGAERDGDTQKRGKVGRNKSRGQSSQTLKSQKSSARGDQIPTSKSQRLKCKPVQSCRSVPHGHTAGDSFDVAQCRQEPSAYEFSQDDESSHSGTERETANEKGKLSSLWAEVKLLDKNDLRLAVLNDHQSEMERMLETIEAHLKYLIETEKNRKWQEAQARHLGYSPQQSLPKSAVWKPKSLENDCS
ncbi:hypothetical protein O6H91_14G057700 [Diphasiastrum complanatum]|uniref:Uncharacterized protein n=1 Tax=Diphasiastrum complanatum TaxID=34168 RepID=A0ACC2BPT6_DIPCM|nr:hypothetical protein O6H91_14G057700 [Diphasiastrum complanatum]